MEGALRLSIVILLNIISIATILFTIYLFTVVHSVMDYILVLLFAILVVISTFFNTYSSTWYYKSYKYEKLFNDKFVHLMKPIRNFPTVAVAMPVYNEDPSMVEKNVKELTKMKYPKSKIRFYMLDDSTDAKKAEEFRRIAKENNFFYIHRNERKGYKAGALNNMLSYSREEYIAIFDSDERLANKNFLIDTLPFMIEDKSVAYVQTEKRFDKGTFFSDSIDIFEAFFFKFVQAGRALNNTTIFAGSCGILRRSAIDAVGGFPEYVLEDTFFSFESALHGFKNVYVPKCYAYGRPLKSFTALAKQQWRYNYGGTQFISYYLAKDRSTLGLSSRIDYILHGAGLDYVSVFLIFFALVSIGIVFIVTPLPPLLLTNIGIIFSNPLYILEMMGIIAFVASFLLPVVIAGIYYGSYKKGFMASLLNYALAIVRTRAAIALLLNREPGSQWTKQLSTKKRNIWNSLYAAKAEIGLAAFIWIFSYVAFLSRNVYGGVWLLGYGVLFSLAALFIKIYG
ncbi:MAG: glycosyltransferase [Candidatus Micrarchaeia archaeon]